MSTFHPNCTLPPSIANFVGAPNTRGTLEILWSCLSVIILCTWTVLHLNVPVQIRPRNTFEKYGLEFQGLMSKVKWMIITVVSPELLLGKAMVDLLSALHSQREMKIFAEKDNVEWTVTHAYFANMGGFSLHFDDSSKQTASVGHDAATQTTGVGQDAATQTTGVGYLSNESFEYEAFQEENNARKIITPDQEVSAPSVIREECTRQQVGTDAIKSLPPTTVVHIEETTAEAPWRAEQSSGVDFSQAGEDCNPNSTLRSNHLGRTNRTSLAPAECGHGPGLGDLSGEVQKAPIQKHLRQSRKPGKRQQQSLCGRMLAIPSTRYGVQTWFLDERNMRLASTAMDALKEDYNLSPAQRSSQQRLQRNLLALRGNPWILDAAQIRLARELGILEHLPNIPEHDLKDQNKGDLLVKALAVLQGSWVIVQLVVRYSKHLPSTQFELITAAFATCSIFTYGLFFLKPKDVGQPRHFPAARYPTSEEILDIAKIGPATFFWFREDYWMPNNTIHKSGTPNDYSRQSFFVWSSTGAVILGATHLFGWNFTFPTTTERLLWRIAALLTAAVIPLFIVLARDFFRMSTSWKRALTETIRTIIPLTLYFLARIYIIVESFRCLWYAPPHVFRTTWSSSVPHIG